VPRSAALVNSVATLKETTLKELDAVAATASDDSLVDHDDVGDIFEADATDARD